MTVGIEKHQVRIPFALRNGGRAEGKQKFSLRSRFKTFTTISTIRVGSSETAFLVHRDLLAHHSPFFAAALTGPFAEGASQVLSLPAEEVSTFELFVAWAYTGRLESGDDDDSTNGDADGVFRRGGKVAFYLLLALYGLADRLAVEALRNAVVDRVAALAEESNSVPTPSDTATLYGEDGGGVRSSAPLRALVVDLFAFKKTDGLLASHPDDWHPLFLRDLVVRLKRPDRHGLERHRLTSWTVVDSSSSSSSTRACWICRHVIQSGEAASRCDDCAYAFCGPCVASAKAPCGDDAAKLASCKPWLTNRCQHYHEHVETPACVERERER